MSLMRLALEQAASKTTAPERAATRGTAATHRAESPPQNLHQPTILPVVALPAARPGMALSDQYSATVHQLLARLAPLSTGTLAFSSPTRNTQTTTTVLELGVALTSAVSGEVLLIDADLEQAGLSRQFGVDSQRGLCDVLFGWSRWSETIRPTTLGRLSMMPAGTYRDAGLQLLAESNLTALVNELKCRFAWILFDGSPAPSPQVGNVARECDATILVAKLDQTRREEVLECSQILEQEGARIWGWVVTGDRRKRKRLASRPDVA